MKKIEIIAWLSLVIAITIWSLILMKCKYGYEKEYTYSDDSIGITHGSDPGTITPANTVYLAPNGSDSNTGLTISDPLLTIEHAIDIVNATGGRDTIYIIRNSYVGEMQFEIVLADKTLTAGYNLVVEESDYAVINIGLYYLWFSSGCYVSGIKFVCSGDISTPNYAIISQNSTFKYCFFEQQYYCHTMITGWSGDWGEFQYCMFAQHNMESGLANKIGIFGEVGDLKNSIMVGFVNALFGGGTDTGINIEYSYFIGCQDVIATGTASAFPVTVSDSLFMSSNNAFVFGSAGSTSITADNCCYININIQTGYDPSYHTFVNTNILEASSPLFVNQDDLVNNYNSNSAKLQIEGMPTIDNSGQYYVTSPLYTAGITPFTQTVTLVDASYTKELEIDWPGKSLEIASNYIGRVENEDINGNSHTYFRSVRRTFSFKYGNTIHVSNRFMKALVDLFADTGSKKFYLQDEGTNLMESGMSSGDFDDSNNSFEPDLAITLIPGNWRGFWITIVTAVYPFYYEYYIYDNDEYKLYLSDKNELGFPASGTYDMYIDHILVNIVSKDFKMNQENFTRFLLGGEIAETTDSARPYDLTIDNIEFKEIEDHEVGV